MCWQRCTEGSLGGRPGQFWNWIKKYHAHPPKKSCPPLQPGGGQIRFALAASLPTDLRRLLICMREKNCSPIEMYLCENRLNRWNTLVGGAEIEFEINWIERWKHTIRAVKVALRGIIPSPNTHHFRATLPIPQAPPLQKLFCQKIGRRKQLYTLT